MSHLQYAKVVENCSEDSQFLNVYIFSSETFATDFFRKYLGFHESSDLSEIVHIWNKKDEMRSWNGSHQRSK